MNFLEMKLNFLIKKDKNSDILNIFEKIPNVFLK